MVSMPRQSYLSGVPSTLGGGFEIIKKKPKRTSRMALGGKGRSAIRGEREGNKKFVLTRQ